MAFCTYDNINDCAKIFLCQRPHLVGTFSGLKMSKSRGREAKLRQKKGRKKREEKTWKHEKTHTHTNLWGVFMAIFAIKLGTNEIFG